MDVTVVTLSGGISATSSTDQIHLYRPRYGADGERGEPGCRLDRRRNNGDPHRDELHRRDDREVRRPVSAASFTVNSATSQITATSPVGAAGAVDVTVTTAAGTSAISTADHFTYTASTPAPAVTAINPSTGPAAGGTSVVITGSDFTGATAVKFGTAAAASFTVNSATQVTATSPAGSGAVDVTVTTSAGTSAAVAADKFTYAAPGGGFQLGAGG